MAARRRGWWNEAGAAAAARDDYWAGLLLIAAATTADDARSGDGDVDVERQLPEGADRPRWRQIAFDADGIARARRAIHAAGFRAIRERAAQVCIGLQALRVPALQLCEIVIVDCAPFAARLDFYLVWNLVVAIKHFRE